MGVEIGAFDSSIQSHRSTATGAVCRDNADILEFSVVAWSGFFGFLGDFLPPARSWFLGYFLPT